MDETKLSELPELAVVPNDAIVYVVHNGISYQAKKQQISNEVNTSKFTSNPIPTIVGTDISIPANETWLIDSVPYTNVAISTIPFSYAPSGLLYFLTVVATKFNTFVGKVGTASADPSEPIVNNDELFLTTYLISDGSVDVIVPPVTSDLFVEKAIFQPQIIYGTTPYGAVGMGKKSALVISGTIPSVEFISKNNPNDYFIGTPFYTINKTPNTVKFPHLSSTIAGNPDSIAWFNPELKDYTSQPGELTLWNLDIVDGQKVYRRASSSLQNESVTLEKLAQMPAKTFLGNAGNASAIPQHIDKIDALEMLGLENIDSDLANKADLVGGVVPSSQLPAYVDDVIEGYLLSGVFYKENTHTTAITGEVGKIYVDLTTGQKSRQYRWSGTVYIQITNGLIASTDDVPEGSNLYFTGARVLATVLTGISFLTGGAIVSTDSVLVAFGKIQKQINDIGTALGLKQDTLTDLNFGTFTNSVATKNTQADTDVLGYLDVTTGKWVKQTFSKLVDYLKGFFQTSRIIVTSNVTAVNGSVYHNNGTVIYTDPTGVAGMGFYVYVAFGTATIGSTTYAKGSYIFRVYDGTNWNTEIIKNGIGQKIITGNVTLNNTYHNCIVLVKNTATITVPYGLTISFNCVFDTWAGATATFVQGTNVDVIETALILSPLKMASLYQDSASKGLTTEFYKLKGETS